MNDLADRHGVCMVHGNSKRLTMEAFEKWLNPSDRSRLMPVKAPLVFCAATGSFSALDALAASLRLLVIGIYKRKMLKWGEARRYMNT